RFPPGLALRFRSAQSSLSLAIPATVPSTSVLRFGSATSSVGGVYFRRTAVSVSVRRPKNRSPRRLITGPDIFDHYLHRRHGTRNARCNTLELQTTNAYTEGN